MTHFSLDATDCHRFCNISAEAKPTKFFFTQLSFVAV